MVDCGSVPEKAEILAGEWVNSAEEGLLKNSRCPNVDLKTLESKEFAVPFCIL